MIKKLILLGFGLVLLIGLPLAVFILQNQTQPTTGAAPVTKFSFTGPATANTGDTLDENLVVDPGGTNQVSFVKFAFTYDPAKLDKAATPITIDTTKYTILEQPAVTCTSSLCTVTGTISVGANQASIIKTVTTIAVVHLIAKANTDSNGTQLLFVAGQNQALSTGASDQAAENVFLSGTPKTIVIGAQSGGGTPTDTPTPTGTGGGTTPTDTPVPTSGGGGGGSSGGGGGTSAAVVSCTSFTADVTSGNAPLVVTFTTVGQSATDTISQITLTYGDGSTDTVASGSGINTGNVNNQISHTYSSNGTFTANATLTTAGSATSDPSTCKQTIIVGAIAQASPTATQKLPPTGPGDTILFVGAMGILMTIAGFAVLAGL